MQHTLRHSGPGRMYVRDRYAPISQKPEQTSRALNHRRGTAAMLRDEDLTSGHGLDAGQRDHLQSCDKSFREQCHDGRLALTRANLAELETKDRAKTVTLHRNELAENVRSFIESTLLYQQPRPVRTYAQYAITASPPRVGLHGCMPAARYSRAQRQEAPYALANSRTLVQA